MQHVPLTIIGAGVIGSALAYELSKEIGGIIVLEKDTRIPGDNQSTRSSSVIHAGYYPQETMPLKAKLCAQGNSLLYHYCTEHQISHAQIGKLVVATNSQEEEYLEEVLKIARENEIPRVTLLTSSQAKEIEPNVHCTSALYFPTSGLLDVPALIESFRKSDAFFVPANKVIGITPSKKNFSLEILCNGHMDTFESEVVINAAGLYADEIAKMVNPQFPYTIIPTRGESAKFYANIPEMQLRHHIYPVPYFYDNQSGERLHVSAKKANELQRLGKATRTVGIHLSPTLAENNEMGKVVTIGPAKAVHVGKEELGHKHQPMHYLNAVQPFFPSLPVDKIELDQSGIMAVLREHADWVIEKDRKYGHFIHLVGIDSPGITACLSIAKYVKEKVLEY